MKPYFSKMNNEEGVTLVELLAAIAILSIIVTAFLAFFVQAGRTNNMTNEVNEATFLAQEEMEEMIHFSKTNSDEFKNRKRDNTPFTIETTINQKIIENSDNIQMNQVIVIVKEGENTRAKMETWLPFSEENPTP